MSKTPQQKKLLERLDKAISAQTSLSRKDVHKLLSRGQICVNGQAMRRFDVRFDPESDEVTLDGKPLPLKRYSYLMLHKPKGVVCATADAALPTVIDLVPAPLMRRGLFPAGRLDKDTTGLVLITNNGELSHRILAPRSHLPKEYLVRLDGPVDRSLEEEFARGVQITPDKHDNDPHGRRDKATCKPAVLRFTDDPCVVRVELRQGMYHQVKRMFSAYGLTVVELHRERIGKLSLDPALSVGECREMTAAEVVLLTAEE